METVLEHWARKKIADAGGLMLKWVSPGTRGVMDDIVFWPDCSAHFIEFKDGVKGTFSHNQNELRERLEGWGFMVFSITHKAEVTAYVERFKPVGFCDCNQGRLPCACGKAASTKEGTL
jgi:hypothetical protein